MALSRINSASIQDGTVIAADVAANSISSNELTTTGVANGVYGGTSQIPVVAIDAQGRVTSASNVAVESAFTTSLFLGGI